MKSLFTYIILTTLLALTCYTATAQILPPPGWENSPGLASGNEGANYRAAIYAERRGDYETALQGYRLLRQINPGKNTYFDGELRCLLTLERFDEALSAIQNEIDKLPDDKANLHKRADLIVQLGEVYLTRNDTDKAWEKWNLALSIDRENIQSYRQISMLLMRKRMVDKAVEVLKKGDAEIGNNILSLDLARAYTAMMNYGESVRYYLIYLQDQMNRYSFVERAIYALPNDNETVNSVISVLEEANTPQAAQILSGYLFSLGRYDESLKVMVKMNAPPQEIINFALQLMGDDNYMLALNAFNSVEEKYPGSRFSSAVNAGKAECLNNSGHYLEAMILYEDIIAKFPRSSNSENACYQLGTIYLEHLNDPDSASTYFMTLKRDFPLGKYAESVGIKLGMCAVMRGDLDEALKHYKDSALRIQKKNVETVSEALLETGKCLLWKGETDSAMVVWQNLSRAYPATDAANDALNYTLTFSDAGEKLVKTYSDAWFASAKRDFQAAKEGFRKVMKSAPGSLISGRSALEYAGIIIDQSEDAQSAIDTLESYLDSNKGAMLADEILMFMAETSERVLADRTKAGEYYERLLSETPDSPLVPIVRNRLEKLTMDKEL